MSKQMQSQVRDVLLCQFCGPENGSNDRQRLQVTSASFSKDWIDVSRVEARRLAEDLLAWADGTLEALE